MNDFGLTPQAIELIKNCPYIINRLADKIEYIVGITVMEEPLEPIEIHTVTYSPAECGYEK